VKRQGKLNTHIICESVLMLFTWKLSKLLCARRNYSLPNLAYFLRQCSIVFSVVVYGIAKVFCSFVF